jgi:ABC-type transport system involved in cytochrome c biogenesis permease subunit
LERSGYSLNAGLAVLTASVGFLTVLIIAVAMFAGLWLDSVFSSKPWFTLGFIALSLPTSLFAMFYVVRWTTSKMSLKDVQTKSVPSKGPDLD